MLECAMPSRARCARVPPPHAWHPLDLTLVQDHQLPLDPRRWDRAQVGRWVSLVGGRPERFPMNGKALCLMTENMFTDRVPDRGRDLYTDFRRRLAKALAFQELIEKMTDKQNKL